MVAQTMSSSFVHKILFSPNVSIFIWIVEYFTDYHVTLC